MNILLLTLLACGDKETEDTGLNIDLDDTNEETDTDTEDTDTAETDTGDTGEVIEELLAIIGEYEDNWGGSHLITADTWVSGDLSFSISQYNNELYTVIAQNAADNQYNPEKWSKFQWSYDLHGNLFYCQVAFEAETEEDAIGTPPADPTNLEAGCGGFGWTMLREPLSLAGNYTDDWGGSHIITSFQWEMGYEGSAPSLFHIIEIHEGENFIIAQNDINNEWSADLWSKFEWTIDSEILYYCQSAYDADSVETALQASADAADVTTGCGGSPWSTLTPAAE